MSAEDLKIELDDITTSIIRDIAKIMGLRYDTAEIFVTYLFSEYTKRLVTKRGLRLPGIGYVSIHPQIKFQRGTKCKYRFTPRDQIVRYVRFYHKSDVKRYTVTEIKPAQQKKEKGSGWDKYRELTVGEKISKEGV